jgi:aspartate kinase
MAVTEPVVIMKFGGTSVADPGAIHRLTAIVAAARTRDAWRPVVVVSAMAGVTDALLALASAAVAGDLEQVTRRVSALHRRHEDALHELVPTRGEVGDFLRQQLEELRAVLEALTVLREAPARALDSIAATGELLSSRIVAAALAEAGIPATWVDPRRTLVTDGAHTTASPLPVPTREAVAREVLPRLDEGLVPVVGGYVGATAAGVTTTLGRGGSDYSAAVIAAAIRDARQEPAGLARAGDPRIEIQIWTDVDGMLTADPRIVRTPRLVPHLSFGEASELAYFGAKVLHPSTILPAVERDIPVRILNSLRPGSSGTLIAAVPPSSQYPVAAIACKRAITVIDVTSTRMLMAHGFLRRLFEVFERCATSVDVVTTSEVSVSVTVDDDRRLEAIVSALTEFADVLVEREMAILCVVGDRLRADGRLAVRLLGSLEGFPLRMVSQAASRRNLTVVLHERDLAEAMNHLHQTWFGEPAPALAAMGAST